MLPLIFIFSCSLPKPKESDSESGSTFYVSSVSKPEWTVTETHEKFSIPVMRQLSTKVCLKDRRQSKDVSLHHFEVEDSLSNEASSVSTDSTGCLVLSQEIKFKAFALPRQILVEKKLKAIGREKGAAIVRLVIDPWTPSAFALKEAAVNEAKYLKGQSASEALSGKNSEGVSFNLDNLKFTLHPTAVNGKQRSVLFEVFGFLAYEATDINGSRYSQTLSQANVRVQYSLYSQNDQGTQANKTFIFKSKSIELADLDRGQFSLHDQISLPGGSLCQSGVVYLGLSVEPVDKTIGLKKTENVYFLGQCETRGTSWATPVSEFKEYLRKIKPQQANEQSQRDQSLIEGFFKQNENFETKTTENKILIKDKNQEAEKSNENNTSHSLDFKLFQFVTTGYRSTSILGERERNLQIQSCLISGWDRQPVRFADLEIIGLNQKIIHTKTNSEGCFLFDDQIKYNIFDQECWKSSKITVKVTKGETSEDIPVVFNSWNKEDSFRDARFLDKDLLKGSCTQNKVEIIPQKFEFARQTINYDVDPALNLIVQKQGQIRVGFQLRRPSFGQTNGFSEESLPPGAYRLRVMIADQSIKDWGLLSGKSNEEIAEALKNKIYFFDERDVEIRQESQVLENYTLQTKFIRKLGNLNQLVLQLVPAHGSKNKNIESLIAKAPLLFSNDNEYSGLTVLREINSDSNLMLIAQKKYIEATNKETNTEKSADKSDLLMSNAVLAKQLGLNLVENNNEIARQLLQSSFDKSMMNSQEKLKQIYSSLCNIWFKDIWKRKISGKSYAILDQGTYFQSEVLANECRRLVQIDPRLAFDIEEKNILADVSVAGIKPVAAPVRDYAISQAFAVSSAEAHSTSVSTSIDFSAGIKAPELLMVNLGAGARMTLSRSASYSDSKSNSISYAANLALSIENLKLSLSAKKSQKCLALKINPALFVAESTYWSPNTWKNSLGNHLSPLEKNWAVTSGYLFCEDIKNEVFEVDENYFLMNQKISTTQILDATTEVNRPFFALIRGEADFFRFLSFVQNSDSTPKQYDTEFQQSYMKTSNFSKAFVRGWGSVDGVVSK